MHILAGLAAIFKVWMLIDALQRCGGRCGNYWYLVILFPFGDWAYFFMVKIHDPEFARIRRRLFYKPPSLDRIRYDAQHCASHENKMRLADALRRANHYSEAKALYEEALQQNSSDKSAKYGLARCELHSGASERAKALLEDLVQDDPDFADYAAALELAKLYQRFGEQEKGVLLLERIARRTHRFDYSLELAKWKIEQGANEEAKAILNDAFLGLKHSPSPWRSTPKASLREARKLLRAI